MMYKHNFSAGPAILPEEVLQQLSEAILNFKGTGLSILELSHRGAYITEMIEETREKIRSLLKLPPTYQPLFLSGGATTHFAMIAQNLLRERGAAYVNTGVWTEKAIHFANQLGDVEVVASSADQKFGYLPEIKPKRSFDYLYLCSNNTVHGTQFKDYPKVDFPLVVDMSSDIFCRPLNINDVDVVVASAQKNLGPAGTTLLIVNESVLKDVKDTLPDIYNYKKHIEKKSVMNTPPVFSIYGCLVYLNWLEKEGLENIYQSNLEKAKMVYQAIDQSNCFRAGVERLKDRSMMNICFDAASEGIENEFLNEAKREGFIGLKGYRKRGGFRASMYNALPESSAKALADFIGYFDRKKG